MTAYRAAMQEQTRERVPLQWAMTQNNLGNALVGLGERESGTARLEEAVTAYRAAIEEFNAGWAEGLLATAQASLIHAEQIISERRIRVRSL